MVCYSYIFPLMPPLGGQRVSRTTIPHTNSDAPQACITLLLWRKLIDDNMKNKQSVWCEFWEATSLILGVWPVRNGWKGRLLSSPHCSSLEQPRPGVFSVLSSSWFIFVLNRRLSHPQESLYFFFICALEMLFLGPLFHPSVPFPSLLLCFQGTSC